MLQTVDVASVRRDLPVTDRLAYLNTGTTGPLPRPTIEMLASEAAREADEGRLGRKLMDAFRADIAELRAQLASYLGADASEIGLTHNATEGVNIAVWGLNWQAGDRVVTTTLEHPGGLLPLYQAQRRFGIEIAFADVGRGERARSLEALSEAIRPGVRLVVLSHVAWSTGAVFPLREITDMAHAVGALVAVDAAQSAGAIPVDVHELGVDLYAFPGQKWLCGPEGTGGVFVQASSLDDFQPTFMGFHGADHDAYRPNDASSLVFEDGAKRYEVASLYKPGLRGLKSSLDWLTAQGPVFHAIRGLAEYCSERVSELPHVEILTPPNAELSGLVAFRVPSVDPVECVAYLAERAVAIRSIPDNGSLRISCGFYNTREEIDRTVELIHEFSRR